MRRLRARWGERRRLEILLAVVIGWVVLISVLHAYVNAHVPVGGSGARTIEVGGLPVT
jgi:hypothetical protein